MRSFLALPLLSAVLCGSLAGCSTDPAASTSKVPVGEREYTTGSNLPSRDRRRPMTPEEQEAHQRDIDTLRSTMQRQGPTRAPGSGG